MAQAAARRSVMLYLGILALLSAAIQGWLIADGRPADQLPAWGIIGLMWVPGVAGILTRLVRRESFADLGLRLGGWRGVRWLGLLLVLPTAVGMVAYGLAWTTGLAEGPLPSPNDPDTSPWIVLLMRLALVVPLGTVFGLFGATGEELGWRGTMLNRLVDARVPHPALVSGLIWGLWHVPLIASGQYTAGTSRLASGVLFVVMVVAMAVIMARAQWRTGSVWMACVYHAVWNATIQGAFDRSTRLTDEAEVWVGESGILIVICQVAVAIVFWFALGPWRIRRHPRDEATLLFGPP